MANTYDSKGIHGKELLDFGTEIAKKIRTDDEVIAASLNNLNSRLEAFENIENWGDILADSINTSEFPLVAGKPMVVVKAGTPSGTSTIPDYAGQFYVDSTNKVIYCSGGYSSVNDWVDVTNKIGTGTVGSATKPIYLNNGVPTECSNFGGGTKVTLNGANRGANTADIYAPTTAGTNNYVLKSNGSGEPSWVEKAPKASAADTATTATDYNTSTGTIKSGLDSKVNIANISLDGQTTTILEKVQALAAANTHYARFFTYSDGGASGISDKPVTGNGFLCEVRCSRRNSSSDYIYQLQCWVRSDTNPFIASVTESSTSISWSRLNTNTDTKVKATAKTDNVNYKILATASASPTSGGATEAVYDADITLNPSTNTIAANISGDAATASAAKSGSTLATTIAGKQDKLTEQTAYTSKGTATKVPQITTNSLGQVTGITEVSISGVAPSSHTHGNISNDGTLTDAATAAAGNDYVVIRDADNAKIQTSTIKGTDVADAVTKKHVHGNITLSTTAQAYDGSHTIAMPASDPYTSARTPASHTHGSITNDGKLGSTANLAVVTGTSGAITASDLTTTAPSASGSTLAFIDSVSQDSKGKITASKKNVTIDTALDSSSTNPVQNKAVKTALDGKVDKVIISQPASYRSFAIIEDITRWASATGDGQLTTYYQMIGELSWWRSGTGNESMDTTYIKYHLNYKWSFSSPTCCEIASTMPEGAIRPMIIKDERNSSDVKYYFGLKIDIAWQNTIQFVGHTRSLSFDNITWLPGATSTSCDLPSGVTIVKDSSPMAWHTKYSDQLYTAKKLAVNLANTSTDSTFNGSQDQTGIKVSGTLAIGNGGTGATTATAARYNILDGMAAGGDDNPSDTTQLVYKYTSPTTSNGYVYYKPVSKLWGYIKGKMSSDSGVNISGNAATATSATTATSAGKLTTARKTYVTLGTASTSTTRDWSGDTTIPVDGQLKVANGGTGSSTAAGARTNLDVYSKSEVDSMLTGRISVVTSLPATGEAGVIYFVGPSGSGSDQYEEYVWDGTQFVKVGEKFLDLSNYVNTLSTSGSGSVLTNLTKSGNTLTVTKGNISLDNLSTWASKTDETIGGTSYHTYWQVAPTSSNTVYGIAIKDGNLYQVKSVNNTKTVRAYDKDDNTTYTQEKLGQGYGTCTTAEATAAKAVSLTNYELVTNGIIAVKFSYGLCASATLNVNSKGAKPIYIQGAAVTSTTAKEVLAGDIALFMYDGSQYQFLCSDRLNKESITGLSISGKTITYTKADGTTGSLTTQDTTYTFDGTYNASSNKAATVSTVTNKIAALDVSDISGFGAGKTLATLTETDGKIAATFQNISITKSQVSDFSHTHGNITNAGALQTTDVTIASGDKLVITDSSDSSKVARASVSFDGSTTTTALTPKGTFEAFAKADDIKLFQAEYGVTTFADVYAAITAKKTVYCKVPGASSGSYRMAFLAYTSVANPPTTSSSIEFQYYSSNSSGTGDSVFVYTITNNNNTWSTTERAVSLVEMTEAEVDDLLASLT